MRPLNLPGAALPATVATWRTAALAAGRSLAAVATLGLVLAVLPLPPVSGSAPPQTGYRIQLVVDRSGSMQRDDVFLPIAGGTERVTRLEAVQRTARRLLDDADSLLLRQGDRIGLVSFAGQVRVDAEPTTDRTLVGDQLRTLRTVATPREDGTAIADAISRAVMDPGASEPVPDEGTVVILLTDGQQNAGQATLDQAQAAAVQSGTPVHVISLRPSRLSAAQSQTWAASDERLRRLADATGGRFFLLRNVGLIGEVFEAIGRQTRSLQPIEEPAASTWRTAAVSAGGLTVPPLSLVIAAMMIAATTVSAVVGRLP